MSWQRSYVAFSMLLGDAEEPVAALAAEADRALAAGHARELASGERAARAKALAAELARIASALEALELGAQ